MCNYFHTKEQGAKNTDGTGFEILMEVMRLQFNYILHLIFGCVLLTGIKCNKSEYSKQSLLSKNDHKSVVGLIKSSYNLMELAEIGEWRGNQLTSCRATALKDSQIIILYILTDYANRNNIDIPRATYSCEDFQMIDFESADFDNQWKEWMNNCTRKMITDLRAHAHHMKHDAVAESAITSALNILKADPDRQRDYTASN
jgi:hypothetical protein